MDAVTDTFNELLMAQQPIFDRHKSLFGYELLFRGDHEGEALFQNPEVATSQVLVNLCMGISILNAQLRQPFFVNMTTELVLSDAFFPISPDTVYIEILEDQQITPAFIAAVKRWHEHGFRFVLDDYQYSESYQPLLPFMSMVKIDVLATTPLSIRPEIERLQALGLALVAEKIEDQDMFSCCVELGFDYFQGYFLSRPEVIKGKRVAADSQSALRLLNALQDVEVSIDDISELVAQTPALSFQMLRLLNSPVVGLAKAVASIKEAITYLGLVQLKRWSMLITLSSNNNGDPESVSRLLARARCCELLAKRSGRVNAEEAFTVGLMSGMDTVLQVPMLELLKQVTLSDGLQDAILKYSGDIGKVLYSVECVEQGRLEKLERFPEPLRVSINACYFESLAWAKEVIQVLQK